MENPFSCHSACASYHKTVKTNEANSIMKKLNRTQRISVPLQTVAKVWLGIVLTAALFTLAVNHSAWARGGHGQGSVIGGGGGGGGGGRSHFGGRGGHIGGGHRHFRGHGHRHHHRHRIGIGFGGFYGPGFFGRGFYGNPYGFGYPYGFGFPRPFYSRGYYAAPYVPRARTVYVQRESSAAPAQQAQNSYWYYCRNPEGYYPYIKQCPEGWLQVAPQPAPQ